MTTDDHKAYLEAVEGAFGADVDYAQLVKLYGASDPEHGYGPAVCIGAKQQAVTGDPDPKQRIPARNVIQRLECLVE